MRTIKITFFIILSLIMTKIYAQENANKFEIELNDIKSSRLELVNFRGDIVIDAHNDNKIVIKAIGLEEMPKRAKGLRRLGVAGEDNTGIGLTLQKSENTIKLVGTVLSSVEYRLLVPEKLKLSIKQDLFNSEDIKINGLKSDLELDVKTSDIKLTNISGPTVISSLDGDVDIIFSEVKQGSPFSITSVSGDIDLSFPKKTPANLDLKCMNGGIYTDLNIEHNKDKKVELSFVGGWSQISGKINGGGVKFVVSAISGDIYLRKKK